MTPERIREAVRIGSSKIRRSRRMYEHFRQLMARRPGLPVAVRRFRPS